MTLKNIFQTFLLHKRKKISIGYAMGIILLFFTVNGVIISSSNPLLLNSGEMRDNRGAEALVFIPKGQQTDVPYVYDCEGQVWDYTTTDYNIEVGEVLNITAIWNETVTDAVLHVQEYLAGSWNDAPTATVLSTTDNTDRSEFSIKFTESDFIGPKRFSITANLTETNQTFTTGWQEYQLIESNVPIITTRVATYNVSEINGKLCIVIDFTGLFYDEGGIDYYVIGRKVAVDDDYLDSNDFNTADVFFYTNQTIFVDDTIEENNFTKFYYAIQAYDYAGNPSGVYSIKSQLSIDIIPPTVESYKLIVNGSLISDNSLLYPSGTFKFQITTQSDCVRVHIKLVNKDLAVVPYEYDLSPYSDSNEVWEVSIDLSHPRSTAGEIRPGAYKIEVELEDDMGNINSNETIDNVFTIVEPTVAEEEGINWTLWGSIIGVTVAAVVVGVVIILKRKQEEEYEEEPEIEFTKGPVKKRKGKIYKGASSLGRASGQAAQDLQRRRGVLKESKKKEGKGRTSAGIKGKSVRSKPVAPSKPRPAAGPRKKDKVEEKDIDKLLSSQPTAMQLKVAEKKVDIVRRMDFVDSKLISLDQNAVLMKVILDQLKNIKIAHTVCPTCGKRIPTIWRQCPYCLIKNKQGELEQKKRYYKPLGSTRICPTCHKVLEPTWDRCPYCFVREKGL